MPPVLRPRALSRGDLVAVAAPSSPVATSDRPLIERGMATLERMGFRVRAMPPATTGRRRWWASGTPAVQARELNALLRDPEVRAIIAHAGGKATFAYLDLIDLDAIRADPKPILGFSDISVLHLALYARTGLVGFHADTLTHGLGHNWHVLADDDRRARLSDVYERVLTKASPAGPLPAASPWECWREGRASGPLVGGLLNRLIRLQGTGYAPPHELFDGAVFFWEEVNRPVAEVWNNLHILRLAGVLDRIAAMVVGVPANVTAPESGPNPPTLREAVLDAIGDRDIPVLGNVDFGHAVPNLPLPIGIRAETDATDRTLSLLEPAVR